MSDYYRPIKREGTHLADSNDTEGAYRGNLLDDETNKPVGNSEWIKVDDSEIEEKYGYKPELEESGCETSIIDELMEAAIYVGVTVLLTGVVIPKSKEICEQKIGPFVSRKWNSLKQHFKNNRSSNRQEDNKELVSTEEIGNAEIVGRIINYLNKACEIWIEDAENEKSQSDLLNGYLIAVIIVLKIKSNIQGMPDEEKQLQDYILWQRLANCLTRLDVINVANQILENNQKLLKINDLELKPIITYKQEGEEVEVLLDANKIRAQLLL